MRASFASYSTFATSDLSFCFFCSSESSLGITRNAVASNVIPLRDVKMMMGVVLWISATSGAKMVTKLPRKSPMPRAETAKTLGKRSNIEM